MGASLWSPRDTSEEVINVNTVDERNELEIEFVGDVEDVTFGWVGYTYDVSWGDRIP